MLIHVFFSNLQILVFQIWNVSLNQKVHHSSQDIIKAHNGEWDSDFRGSVTFLNQYPNSLKIPTYTNTKQKYILFLLSGCSVVSNSLQPHGLQRTMHPCPSPSLGVCSNTCPSSWWCHPTISSSVVHFSCLQSFPASGSFLRSQLFASGGQNIGVSASASVLPMNIQDWFPLGWTGLSSCSPRDSQ